MGIGDGGGDWLTAHHAKPRIGSVIAIDAKPMRAITRVAASPGAWAALLTALLLAPSVSVWPAWGDALEFTGGAPLLAILHPTGYPLQSLVAKLVSEVPISSVARRMNALSWVSMSIASALWASAALLLLSRIAPRGDDLGRSRFLRLEWVLAVAGAVFLTTGPTGRELGTTAELYAFHYAIQNTLLLLALRIVLISPRGSSSKSAAHRASGWRLGRPVETGAFLCGLGLAHHRMIVLAMGVFGLAVLWHWFARRQRVLRSFLLACAFGLVGLTPWVYLPVRASSDPLQNWGDPDTAEQLLWTVRGGEFVQLHLAHQDPERPGQSLSSEALRDYMANRWAQVMDWASAEVVPRSAWRIVPPRWLLLAFVALALTACWRLSATERICLAGVPMEAGGAPVAVGILLAGFMAGGALVFIYRIVDPNGYLLAVFMIAGLLVLSGLMVACATIEGFLRSRSEPEVGPTYGPRGVWIGVLLAVACWSWAQHRDPAITLLERGLDADAVSRLASMPETYAYRALDAVPPNGVLLAQGDNEIFSLWYAQGANKTRMDVLPIGISFLKEEWYAAMLNAHPARLEGVGFGGGTPRTVQEFAARVYYQAILPAFQAGRPVFILTADAYAIEELSKALRVVEHAELLTPEEEAAVEASYTVTKIGPVLFQLLPPQ